MENKEIINPENQPREPEYVPFAVLGETYQTLLCPKFMLRKPFEPRNLKKVFSFIPGTIKKVHVKPGQKVKKGDKLLVLEAMKMHNDIVAPVSGKVDKVNVKLNSVVTKNELLIELK